MAPSNQTLVLGIGNLLMGDEGVGSVVAQQLADQRLEAGAVVVDGGTGGFHLLGLLTGHDPVVIVDATLDGQRPGTVSVLRPRYATDFPRSLTAHDIGLRDLVEAAALLGPLPEVHLVTVSIGEAPELGTELSAPVRAAVPAVVERVRAIVADLARQRSG